VGQLNADGRERGQSTWDYSSPRPPRNPCCKCTRTVAINSLSSKCIAQLTFKRLMTLGYTKVLIVVHARDVVYCTMWAYVCHSRSHIALCPCLLPQKPYRRFVATREDVISFDYSSFTVNKRHSYHSGTRSLGAYCALTIKSGEVSPVIFPQFPNIVAHSRRRRFGTVPGVWEVVFQ